jgi:hypothetical protein
MHYDGLKKQTLVWCEGYKEEADLKNKMPKDNAPYKVLHDYFYKNGVSK